MNKPKLNFVVPGFSKCGTTTLCSLLEQHPDIFIPEDKELMFFNNRNYQKHWGTYAKYFSESGEGQLLGEGTTFYSTKKDGDFASKEIKRHYPEVKLIFIARDPISRIESSYREFHHSGPKFALRTPFSLERALQELPALIDDTMYWARISAYKNQFQEKSIHVIFLEDLKNDTTKTMNTCFEFLGLPPQNIQFKTNTKLNPGSSKLRDTRLLRKIRSVPVIGPLLEKIPIETQDKVFKLMFLRTPFRNRNLWTKGAIKFVTEKVDTDASKFLKEHKKPINFWQKYHQTRESLHKR